MKPLRFHPAAAEEYVTATAYYGHIDTTLARRFQHEIERLLEEIKSAPHQFNQFEPPARRHLSTAFPYAVIYLNEPDFISIIAIMHLKRKPNYWQQRSPLSFD